MTLEELKKLEPSLANSVKLKCYNGMYTERLKKIIVIGIISNRRINIIDYNGEARNIGITTLVNLELIREERKKIELAHFYYDSGDITLLTADGKKWIGFGARELRTISGIYRRCPNMKNIFIYEDDFSIVDEE